jgi:tetratricopeptide (TPR) repeat protein
MRASLLVWITFLSVGMLWAQKGGGGTPPPATPLPGNAPNADPSKNVFGLPQVTATTLSGRVTMEDGTPPPGRVILERFCADGTAYAEAATDGKGRFGADLSARYHPSQDGTNGRINDRNPLVGCKLRAVLGGYTSDAIDLGRLQLATSNEIGKIVLHKTAGIAGASISETTQSAPKEARKNYDKAHDLLAKGKPDEGQKSLEKAVAAYPEFAAAWYDLGALYLRKDSLADARNAFKSSMAADAHFVPPVEGLAMVAVREDKWEEVLQLTSEVIRLDPVDFAAAYFFHGMASYRKRDFDAAAKSTREAIKLDRLHEFPQAQYQLGLILMMKGDLPGAGEQFRAYLAANPNGDDAAGARRQLETLTSRAR